MMGKHYQLFVALLTCCVVACNSPEPGISETKETVDTLSTFPDSTETTPYDPDPTDSIAAGSYSINSSSAQTASLIRASLQEEYRSDLEKNMVDSISRKFIFFEYDLNDDGYKEIFVGLTGPYFCGSGGCTIYLLDHQSKLINTFTVAGYPIVIDNKKTNGFRDLFIHSGKKDRIVQFDGKKYPSNPSMLPALSVAPGDGLTRALDWTHEPYPWFRF